MTTNQASTARSAGGRLRHRAAAVVIGLIAGSLSVGAPAATSAFAAPGDAQPLITTKIGTPSFANQGEVIQYVINYTCSNADPTPPVDGCDGALFADPIPKFLDIYGNLAPLEFVSATGPASVWPSGFSLDNTDPQNPVVVGTAGTWAPGSSGAIVVNVRVPVGTVPVLQQTVSNTATVTDPDDSSVDPSTTALTDIAGAAPQWTIGKIGPTTTRMNRNVTWVVSVCTTTNSTLYPIFEITDTIPPGVQFVSASNGGVYTDDGETANISDGAGVVTWTFDVNNRPPLGSDGCFRMNVTGSFPSSYVDPVSSDHPNDDNVGGAEKTDVATVVGRDTPTGPTTDIGTAPWTTTLIGAVFGTGDGGTTKRFTDLSGNDNFYTVVGDEGRFNLSASIDSDLPADTFTVTDGTNTYFSGTGGNPTSTGNSMPDSFYPTSVLPGTWNAAITARLEGSDDNFATTTVIDASVASGDAAITLSPSFRSVRLVFDNGADSVPGNFALTGMRINGTLGTPAPSSAFGLYTNTSTLSVTRGANTVTASDFDQYILESPLPHPQINKFVANSRRQPGQTTVYTINVNNNGDATGNLVNPYVEDCVPDYFTIQGSPALGSGWAAGTPLPTCASGETPLRFDYTGTLTPGQSTSNINYTVLVDPQSPGPIAPPGWYPNTAYVRPNGGGNFGHCVNTNPSCGSTATVQVETAIEINSAKCVTGDIDGGIFRPSPGCETDPGGPVVAAQTRPGGLMTWELRLINTGNVDATNVDFIDLFPKVGDTAVITETASTSDGDTLNQRFSEYGPHLVEPITAPPGWTVSYSTSANPCRSEVGRNTSCQAPNWVTNPPFLSLPTFQSVKFHFSGTLAMGGSATFAWTTRAPVTDPTYDQGGSSSIDPYEFLLTCTAQTPRTDPTHCPRAVNSFAYGADATNLPVGVPQPSRLYAEPPAVEVRVTAPPKPNAIGNRVFLDRNYDGIQAADTSAGGEPGIANVYVELYRLDEALSTPGNPVYTYYGYTFTDALGNYLFSADPDDPTSGLPDGTYKVRFVPPSQYYVSPGDASGVGTDVGAPGGPNAGTNTDDDSDVSRTPSTALALTPATPVGPSNGGSLGSFYDTVDVYLGDNNNVNVGTPAEGEIDNTWDLGLWLPAPAIDVVKVTKDTAWPDNQAGDGVTIIQGRPVTWIYTITNTGNTRLEDVTLTDDGGPDASFSVTNCSITGNGTNADGLSSSASAPIALNRGATMRCTATGTAQRTNYSNIITVVGTPTLDDGTTITRGSVPSTVTDNDPSSYISGKYDLALAKTAGTLDLSTGLVTYTIVVRNEGTVASGDYQITDILPNGVSYVSSSASPALTSSSGGTLVWDLTGLATSSNRTITYQGQVDNYLVRPFRNYAEISDDSSESAQTGGVSTPTTDSDSAPDANIANDNVGNGVATGNGYGPVGTPTASVDNANITQAGSRLFPDSGDDANDGEDDADIADLSPVLTYDLALAKVASASPVGLGVDPVFTVRVYNQGNVPSGAVTVRDQIPTGLTFTTTGSTAGCVATTGNQVICTLSSIAPGGSTVLTLATTIDGTPDDYSTAPWRNWAEIDSDSAQLLYGVDDADSQPEGSELDGVGANGTLPGDAYVGVASAGGSYATPVGVDEDDNDDGVVATTVVYDLALAKTVANFDIGTGLMDFTITVANQGTVASGAYTVQDVLPAGLSVQGAASPVVSSSSGTAVSGITMSWAMPSLPSAGTATITFQAKIEDYKLRPFRNVAEITDDSAAELYVIADVDSTPDTNTSNDGNYGTIGSAGGIDNTSIAGAGVGADSPGSGGQDDADIADVLVPVTYDLALAKVASASPVGLGVDPVFTVRVYNQGNVPSGAVTVRDQMPFGLTFTTTGSTAGCVASTGNQVICTLSSIAPGGSTVLTLATTINGTPDNYSTAAWQNWAEIDTDSAQSLYGVDDVDSQPEGSESDGVGSNATLPGDAYVGVDSAGVSYATPVGVDEDDNDDAVVTTSVLYDLALAKTVANFDIGTGLMDFTITVRNQGTVPSGVYDVQDLLPAGLSVVGAATPAATTSTGTSATGITMTWTNQPNLEPNTQTTFTFQAQIDDYTLRPFRNIAEITNDSAQELYVLNDDDSTPDTNTSNDGSYGTIGSAGGIDNTSIAGAGVGADSPGSGGQDDADIADVLVPVVYDLALVKTANATLVTQVSTITYSITVANQGNVPSGAFVVTDTVPTGLAFSGSATGGVSVPGSPALVTFAGTNLAPGASRTYTWTATVTDVTQRPFRNVAEISDDSSGELYNVTDTDSTPDSDVGNDGDYGPRGTPSDIDGTSIADSGVRGGDPQDDADIADVDLEDLRYDLALAKTVDSPTVAYDGTITFTVTIQNQGNLDSKQVEVTDWIPAGLVVANAGDGVLNGAGTTLTWTIADIAAGATVTKTFTATVADMTKRPFRNIAEITADGADFYDISVPGNIIDVEDADSTPDTDRSNDGTYGPVMNPGTIDNTGSNAVGSAGVGSDPSDDADIADVDVPVTYDLALVKTGPGSISPLGTATFTILVRNQGNVPSGPFSVTDWVPDGMEAIGASDGGDFSNRLMAVTWTDLPSLAPGATETLTVNMRIVDITKRPFVNTAEISADGADLYDVPLVADGPGRPGTPAVDVEDADSVPDATIDNDVLVDQTVLPASQYNDPDVDEDDHDVAPLTTDVVYDLALIKTVDSSSIAYNGTATFSITIVNQGTVDSGSFTVVDTLPDGTAFVSASDGGVTSNGASVVTWTLSSLPAGESRVLTVVVRPVDLTKRPYRNVAEITQDSAAIYSTPTVTVTDADSVPGDVGTSAADNTTVPEAGAGSDAGYDDEDIAVFDVPVVYDLALVKIVTPGQLYRLGGAINYTIEVKNQGTVPSGLVSVQDVIPAGMSFLSASDGGVVVAGAVFWTDIPSIAPGAIKVLSLQLRLDDLTQPSYRNVAEITTDGSAVYSTPTVVVTDKDSTPDANPNNDPVIDNDDVNVDSIPGDEDDHDIALLDLLKIDIDNRAPVPVTQLPRTGGDVLSLLALAAGLVGLGVLLRSRRRRPTAA